MKVQLKENLIFINKTDTEDRFKLIKWHFYCQDEEIWCARTKDSIYPLREIYLPDYLVMVDGSAVEDYELYEED